MRRPLFALLAALATTGALLGAGPAQAQPDRAAGPAVLLLDRDGALLRFDDPDAPPRLVTTIAADPRGGTWWRMAATPDGDVVVLSTEGSLGRVEVATGTTTTVDAGPEGGGGVATGPRGHLYLTDDDGSGHARVTRTRADGSRPTVLASGLAHVVTEVLPGGTLIAVPIADASVRRIAPGRGSTAVTPRLRGWVTDAHRTPDGGLVVATERALIRFGPDGTRERLARGMFTGAAVTSDGGVVASFRFDLPHTRDVAETGGLLRVDPTTAGLSVEEPETFPEDVVVLGEAP